MGLITYIMFLQSLPMKLINIQQTACMYILSWHYSTAQLKVTSTHGMYMCKENNGKKWAGLIILWKYNNNCYSLRWAYPIIICGKLHKDNQPCPPCIIGNYVFPCSMFFYVHSLPFSWTVLATNTYSVITALIDCTIHCSCYIKFLQKPHK